MECAVSGQTVVTRHYASFTPRVPRPVQPEDGSPPAEVEEAGPTRYYALASPPSDDGQWKGTIQTMPVALEQVAEDISRTGQSGVLRWNPIYIQTPTGYLKPKTMVSIPITAGTATEIAEQIRRGAPTRVSTTAEVSGRGVMTIEIDLDIWPPFAGM